MLPALFSIGALLAVQGLASLLLSRRLFLQFSAVAQLGAFGLFMAVYFAEPSLGIHGQCPCRSPIRWMLASSPVFWLLGLLNELNGTLPPELNWLALRAWIGCAAVAVWASASLWLCYVRTMKKTVEQPDLVPGAGGFHVRPWMSGLRLAILLFSVRSLLRSRQHRVVSAFYASLVLAFALSCRHLTVCDVGTLPADYLISTFMMMTLSVFGLRMVCRMPFAQCQLDAAPDATTPGGEILRRDPHSLSVACGGAGPADGVSAGRALHHLSWPLLI